MDTEKPMSYASTAYGDMLRGFWADGHAENYMKCMIWEYAVMLFGFETYFRAVGEPAIPELFASQERYRASIMSEAELVRTGREPHPAMDDAAWTAMVMMATYRMTGDEACLGRCRRVIAASYAYWGDGDLSHGLWYRLDDRGNGQHLGLNVKSLYCVGLVLSALQYCAVREDPELLAQTMALYGWAEGSMRRPYDSLYFCDFIDGAPRGLDAPYATGVMSMFGCMGMAAINAQLYRMTGDAGFRGKAVATAGSVIHGYYNDRGILRNDRDAWTNCAFLGFFTNDVCRLDGVDGAAFAELLAHTAEAIMSRCRTQNGRYGADWDGGSRWISSGEFGSPDKIMTCANTAHVLFAAALAAKIWGLPPHKKVLK